MASIEHPYVPNAHGGSAVGNWTHQRWLWRSREKNVSGLARSARSAVIGDRYPAREPRTRAWVYRFTLSFSAIARTRNTFTASCMKNADESDFDSFIKSPLHRWKALHPYYLVNAQRKRYLLSHQLGTGNRQRYQSGRFNRETLWHLDSKYPAMCQKRSYFYHLSDRRWCGDFSQRRKSKKLSMG